LIEREYFVNTESKLIDGIEDPEVDELIKLSEMRRATKKKGDK
jgi:hypothetical protein